MVAPVRFSGNSRVPERLRLDMSLEVLISNDAIRGESRSKREKKNQFEGMNHEGRETN